ncbi:MAG: hypothetical protein IMW96_08240 [Thermoanaerobacteraceae bacterium]|uniref:hypothetical protein n=1 Tax=Thermanaeromonas sp. C210 TaxID=2731925 RepID=UPI00155C6CFB|nr:hypothetical protein [Thermanaeromonas sp. C210]MBE3581604.1 hypothetical protein [Thermoanaerobacteraceae bacterium]GFN23829.1 hypothetical protein TAMC210_21460 [Thermanaeromonas sp. C210]
MGGQITTLCILLLLFYLALRAKVRRYRLTGNVEGVPSPASRALAELVAVAGGIYLSLIMLVSFLKLSLPETVSVGGWQVDPLALLALTVALLQPLLLSWRPRR